jgi:hypothetical protein
MEKKSRYYHRFFSELEVWMPPDLKGQQRAEFVQKRQDDSRRPHEDSGSIYICADAKFVETFLHG